MTSIATAEVAASKPSETRKYTREQLEQELARPKRAGGRPRKFATEEERRAARAAYARAHYWRKKCEEAGIEITEDIAIPSTYVITFKVR